MQADSSLAPSQPTRSIGRILMALGITFALVLGAWLIGGRQGFDDLGSGGKNARMLPRVGEVAPELQAYRINDSLELVLVSLSDYAGKPIWINFWGSWCQPCRAEMPDLIEAQKQLEGSGIVMLAISLDEPIEDAYLYAAQNRANFIILSDPNRQYVGENYQINNFPTHIFIDASGIVREVQLAPLSVDAALAAAEKAINPEVETS